MVRFWGLALVVFLVFLTMAPRATRSRVPSWTTSDHPRLIATAGEKDAVVARLTTSGTVSNAVWTNFLGSNRANITSGGVVNYADAGVLYWITGNATYGQNAHDAVMNHMSRYPNAIQPATSGFSIGFWMYRDFLLNYDFAYDRFTAAERDQILRYITLQGTKCTAWGTSWAPGNIAGLAGLCEYASGIMLEGEAVTITVTDEAVVRGSGTRDTLSYPTNTSNISIRSTPGGPVTYVAGTDYTTCNSTVLGDRCIDWSPSGTEPAVGSTYYVSYTVTPTPAAWKSTARNFLDYHLNYLWHDGYYNAGLNPYAGVMADVLLYMIEMAKRDLGVDYARNEDLKKWIDMYLYERLPSNGGYNNRYNTINDTAAWNENNTWIHPEESAGIRGEPRIIAAWGTSAFSYDLEYAKKYLWFWGQAFRNSNGTVKPWSGGSDWREAWWFNNSLAGSYPVTTLPTPNWPKHRYFRGHEVVYTRTDTFGAYDANATLVSMVAGPHNYLNEHDQGDAGSFTFYSLNEDWAIDPGYYDDPGTAGLNLYDHNSVGIDGAGFDLAGSGAYPVGTPTFGGFASFDTVVLTDGASAMKANLAGAWSTTTTPGVQKDERYMALINGAQPSYFIVADDIQKDANAHSYEWYLHTGPGNTISIDGNTATVTGGRNSTTMDVFSLNPQTVTVTQALSDAGNMPNHQRLRVQTTAVNPRFLHLLVPTPQGKTKPTVVRTVVTNGISAKVTWPDNTIDTILWRTASGIVSADGISTDAVLTVVRKLDRSITGMLMIDGRSLEDGGQTIVSVLDGSQPITISAFGPTAGLAARDAAVIRLALPYVTATTIEDGTISIPVTQNNSVAAINAGLPLSEMRRGAGIRYFEDFENTYADNLVLFNSNRYPAENLTAVSGALELKTTAYDWPSISRRDSTPWRRTGIFPTVIPPLDHADADLSFRFRFNDAAASGRKLRFYARTKDRNAADWVVNQDYVRLEFDPIAGTVTLGQRVNGPWNATNDNDILTATITSGTSSFNDTSWHSVKLRLLGDQATLTFDDRELFSASLPTTIPAAPASGYLQWRVVGSSSVFIDDLQVRVIDRTRPVAPTAGELLIDQNGRGALSLAYDNGLSTDAATVTLYESTTMIEPTTDPSTLTVLTTQPASAATFEFAGALRTLSHAVSAKDSSGNESALLPLTVDTVPPSTITDLQTP